MPGRERRSATYPSSNTRALRWAAGTSTHRRQDQRHIRSIRSTWSVQHLLRARQHSRGQRHGTLLKGRRRGECFPPEGGGRAGPCTGADPPPVCPETSSLGTGAGRRGRGPARGTNSGLNLPAAENEFVKTRPRPHLLLLPRGLPRTPFPRRFSCQPRRLLSATQHPRSGRVMGDTRKSGRRRQGPTRQGPPMMNATCFLPKRKPSRKRRVCLSRLWGPRAHPSRFMLGSRTLSAQGREEKQLHAQCRGRAGRRGCQGTFAPGRNSALKNTTEFSSALGARRPAACCTDEASCTPNPCPRRSPHATRLVVTSLHGAARPSNTFQPEDVIV